MGLNIRRLQEDDVVENFDCKDDPLNNYLKKHAWTNQQKILVGVTYVAVGESAPTMVLGYFTLATSAVPRDSFPKKHVRGLPAYDLPLILLARLAVDYRFGGKGLGPQLLRGRLHGEIDLVLLDLPMPPRRLRRTRSTTNGNA